MVKNENTKYELEKRKSALTFDQGGLEKKAMRKYFFIENPLRPNLVGKRQFLLKTHISKLIFNSYGTS